MSFPIYVDLEAETAGIDVCGTTKYFPLGTIGKCDLRTFVYAYAAGTLNPDLGCSPDYEQAVGYSNVAANASDGDVEITFDLGSSAGGDADGNMAEDELEGGYCVVFDASSKAFNRRIVGNTAVTGGAGGECTITVDHPIPVALIEDTDHIECVHSPYWRVVTSTAAYKSVVGMPTLVATSGQYLWLQTGGPCWIAPQTAVGEGSDNNRLCIFRHDGSIDELDYSDDYNNKGQIAGWNMYDTPGGGQGAAFIFLQIGPM